MEIIKALLEKLAEAQGEYQFSLVSTREGWNVERWTEEGPKCPAESLSTPEAALLRALNDGAVRARQLADLAANQAQARKTEAERLEGLSQAAKTAKG